MPTSRTVEPTACHCRVARRPRRPGTGWIASPADDVGARKPIVAGAITGQAWKTSRMRCHQLTHRAMSDHLERGAAGYAASCVSAITVSRHQPRRNRATIARKSSTSGAASTIVGLSPTDAHRRTAKANSTAISSSAPALGIVVRRCASSGTTTADRDRRQRTDGRFVAGHRRIVLRMLATTVSASTPGRRAFIVGDRPSNPEAMNASPSNRRYARRRMLCSCRPADDNRRMARASLLGVCCLQR